MINFRDNFNQFYVKKFKENKKFLVFVLILNFIYTSLYLYIFRYNYGWDTTGYIGIGNILFNSSNQNFWDIKYYYSPGYSLFLGLTGVLNFKTLFFYKFVTFLIVLIYPFFVFYILEKYDLIAAKIASILTIILFCNTIYASDMAPHYLTHFFLIVSIFFITRENFINNKYNQIFFSIFFIITCFFRGTTIFLLPWFFFFSFISFYRIEKKFFSKKFFFLIIRFVVIYLIIVGSYSIFRAAQFIKVEKSLENSLFFGVTKGLGPRVIFQGFYTAGSFYLNKKDNDVIFSPNNGEASQEYFNGIKKSLEKLDYSTNPIKEFAKNSQEAYDYLIKKPSHDTWYYLGWWLMGEGFGYNLDHQDKILKKVVIEAVKNNPELYKYLIYNLYEWFLGSSKQVYLGKGFCDIKIVGLKNCFGDETFRTWPVPTVDDPVSKIIIEQTSVNLYEKMYESSKKIYSNKFLLNFLNKFTFKIIKILELRPILTILSLIAVIIVFFNYNLRLILLLNLSIMLSLSVLVSIVWPASIRYWIGSYIFLIMNASIVMSIVFKKIKLILKSNLK